jgi:hypothetical protein
LALLNKNCVADGATAPSAKEVAKQLTSLDSQVVDVLNVAVVPDTDTALSFVRPVLPPAAVACPYATTTADADKATVEIGCVYVLVPKLALVPTVCVVPLTVTI